MSKLRVTGLCEGNSPVTGEFPAQMASNAENVSIWWRHHVLTFARPFRSIPPKSIITRFATLRITFLTILDVTGWNIRGCQEFKFKLFIPSTASNHSIVFLVNFCCFNPLRAGPNLREVWSNLWYLQAGDILISISIWNSIIYNVSLGHICERRILALSVHVIIYIYIYICVCVCVCFTFRHCSLIGVLYLYMCAHVLSFNFDSCVYNTWIFFQSWMICKFISIRIRVSCCVYSSNVLVLGIVSVVGNVFEAMWKKVLFGVGVDRLSVAEPFAYKSTIKLAFTAIRTKPIWIYTDLSCYLISYWISYMMYIMLVYTCLCQEMHTLSSSYIVYIYFMIAVVFTMMQ